MTRMKGASI